MKCPGFAMNGTPCLLEAGHTGIHRSIGAGMSEADVLSARVAALEGALKFYADPESYESVVTPSLPCNDLLRDEVDPPLVLIDAGWKAREVLGDE